MGAERYPRPLGIDEANDLAPLRGLVRSVSQPMRVLLILTVLPRGTLANT